LTRISKLFQFSSFIDPVSPLSARTLWKNSVKNFYIFPRPFIVCHLRIRPQTGDIGRFNADGTLAIVDRKKDLIKLAGGEYIGAQSSTFKSHFFCWERMEKWKKLLILNSIPFFVCMMFFLAGGKRFFAQRWARSRPSSSRSR
jgi:hypothetical protein